MKTLTLKIKQDQDAESPDSRGDKSLFLVANHRSFFVPPERNRRNFSVQDEIDSMKSTHHVFLLEAYIHSGVVLALQGEGNFCDRQWDVSTLGAVFASKEEWRLRKSARKAALGLIETWNQYLSGDVWGCVVEDEEGDHVDSCWGFYGREYVEKEGAEMLAAAQKAAVAEEQEAFQMACADVATV